MNISVSTRDQRRGIERLSDACNELLLNYTRGPAWISVAHEEAFAILFELAKKLECEKTELLKAHERERLVPVYRQHQPTQWSKCLLADPCEVCAPHRECKPGGTRCRVCVKGKRPDCPKIQSATPAFTVTKSAAVKMVRMGLAKFVNRQVALQLTFSQITELRGGSVRIDEGFLVAYAMGKAWAVEVIEGKNGWEESSTGSQFTTRWPITYGDAVCAWPQIARVMQPSSRLLRIAASAS
jgi:hypothetical protein